MGSNMMMYSYSAPVTPRTSISSCSSYSFTPFGIANSTTTIPSFCGVDDVEMDNGIFDCSSKLNDVCARSSISRTTQKLKNIFIPKLSYTPRRRQPVTLSTSQSNQVRRKNSKKVSRRPKLCRNSRSLDKMSQTPQKTKSKITWRPNLKIIMNDEILLAALIRFCESRFNDENILFLLEAQELSNCDVHEIDSRIASIYHTYVKQHAPKQINLSYFCMSATECKMTQLDTTTFDEKRLVFALCIKEIENLMSSVLSSFYHTVAFQRVATKSKAFQTRKSIASPMKMKKYALRRSALKRPSPIQINMSKSVFEFDS